jgi:hypothetical protein
MSESDESSIWDTAQNPYPGGAYPSERRIGQFNSLQMGPVTVHPEDLSVDSNYFGMRHTDTGLNAFLTGATGEKYFVMHAARGEDDGSLAVAMVNGFRTTPDGFAFDTRYSADWNEVSQTFSDGRVVYSLKGATNAEEVKIGATDLEWKDVKGDIQLAGTLAGQGTQWRHAWRSPDNETGELLFNHHAYSVTGSYFGDEVSGHVLIEHYWGEKTYINTWYVQNRVGSWCCFTNDYEDGTSEHGDIFSGEYGMYGAIVTDNEGRAVLCSTNVNAFDEPDGGVRYEFGNGEVWKFTADPKREISFPRTRHSSGSIQRIGEKRTLVESNCNFQKQERFAAPRAPQ